MVRFFPNTGSGSDKLGYYKRRKGYRNYDNVYDAGMDTGDMLLKAEIEISDDMTAGELHDKLACLGAEVLRETLKRLRTVLSRGFPSPTSKLHMRLCWTKLLMYNWSNRQGMSQSCKGNKSVAVAFTYYKGQKMKVWVTSVLDEENHNFTPVPF